jgi:hypothetical protein
MPGMSGALPSDDGRIPVPMHEYAPEVPPLPPSLLKCPSDLGGADEIELPPSRASSADPVDWSFVPNGTRIGDLGDDQDPNDFVGFEDHDQYGDVPVKPARKHYVRDHYGLDPNELFIHEESDQSREVLPTKVRKNQSPRPVIDHNKQVQRLVECMPHLKQLQTYSSRAP